MYSLPYLNFLIPIHHTYPVTVLEKISQLETEQGTEQFLGNRGISNIIWNLGSFPFRSFWDRVFLISLLHLMPAFCMRRLCGTASEINRIYFIATCIPYPRPCPPGTKRKRGEEKKKTKATYFYAIRVNRRRQQRKRRPHPAHSAHTGLSFLCAFVCSLCTEPLPPNPYTPLFCVANCHEKFESRVDLKSVALCIFMLFSPR